jgi:cold shock CspA family protein
VRYQGRIKTWKDDKGFGFVVPNGGGPDVFLHISEFAAPRRRPNVGDLVTYELSIDDRKRPSATEVRFAGEREPATKNAWSPVGSVLVVLASLSFVGYIGYVRLSHPNSTISASLYKVIFARDALDNEGEFQCTPPKNFCSEMTSCSEAFFYQDRCGVGDMDGDRDGIPCEQQWCN